MKNEKKRKGDDKSKGFTNEQKKKQNTKPSK